MPGGVHPSTAKDSTPARSLISAFSRPKSNVADASGFGAIRSFWQQRQEANFQNLKGTIVRYVVLIFVALILASLGSALYYLFKDKGGSDRTVRALTYRVGLSITLFIMLMLGYYFGWLPASGL